MNYPAYGYNPAFGAQRPPAAFWGAPPPVPAFQQQSAPAPGNGQNLAGFLVQPVTSREEALAVIADPMVSGVLLPDLGHGVIYMKRFNPQNGTSDFLEFSFVQPTQAVEKAVETPEYVTRKDFDEAMAQLRAELVPRGKRLKEVAAQDE